MNKVFLSFFLLLSLITPVRAETVTIGTASVTYETPQGFAKADALFPLQLETIDKAFSLHTVVFAKYVPLAWLEARKTNADAEAIPDWYIHLAYDEKFSKLPLNRAGFVTATALLNKSISYEYTRDSFIRKLEDVFSNAIGVKLIIANMKQKGFVEKRREAHSMLATGRVTIEGEADPTELPIATMATFVLNQRRFITILQIGRIDSEADLPAFTRQALDRIAQIFPSTDSGRQHED